MTSVRRQLECKEEVRAGDTWEMVEIVGLEEVSKGKGIEREENLDLSLE